jgi:hypothetical protein
MHREDPRCATDDSERRPERPIGTACPPACAHGRTSAAAAFGAGSLLAVHRCTRPSAARNSFPLDTLQRLRLVLERPPPRRD